MGVSSDIYSEWFLSLNDKANIAAYRCRDRRRKTLTTRLLNPIWNHAARFIPQTVAPNVITLAGFTCTLQVAYVSARARYMWAVDACADCMEFSA
jgi:hypothetical protein